MIPELAHFTLILACCFAAALSLVPYVNQLRPWLSALTIGHSLFLTLSFTLLACSFVLDDFSIAYVATQSHSALPTIYKFCALWSGHEGSLVLWSLFLSGWMLAIALYKKLPPLVLTRLLGWLALLNTGWLLLILLSANPWQRLTELPFEGVDLNPLLQDPGLSIHPPMLYMGYVGLAVPFAFALSARQMQQRSLLLWLRPWALAAWGFLTCGITLGSWWAYYELGWGGWWFWDPVENASLVPWLLATAVVHLIPLALKHPRYYAMLLLAALAGFVISIGGVLLVRSNLLISVHSFALEPSRGIALGAYLGGLVGIAVWGSVRPLTRLTPLSKRLTRRDILLGSNALFMAVAAAIVLIGTCYPLLAEICTGERLSVGEPYFNTTLIPLSLALLYSLLFTFPRIAASPKTLTLIACIGAIWGYTLHADLYFALGMSLSVLIVLTGLYSAYCSPHQAGMHIAHIGVALLAIGMGIVSHYETQHEVRLAPGQEITLTSSYTIKFVATTPVEGSNYVGQQGQFLLLKNNSPVTTLYPEKRFYLAQETALTETAIHIGWWADVYIALAEYIDRQDWAVRFYYKPFVRWIWGGSFVMVIGMLFAFSRKSYVR